MTIAIWGGKKGNQNKETQSQQFGLACIVLRLECVHPGGASRHTIDSLLIQSLLVEEGDALLDNCGDFMLRIKPGDLDRPHQGSPKDVIILRRDNIRWGGFLLCAKRGISIEEVRRKGYLGRVQSPKEMEN